MTHINTRSTALQNQQGNILFSSLLVLLLMNLLGIGLMQSAMKESRQSNFKRIDTMLFHATESCGKEAIAWLKAQDRPSEVLPYTITRNDLTHFNTGGETQEELNQMSGYDYTCTISELIMKSVSGEDLGTGEQIGESDGYGQGGDLSPKFFYEVAAVGNGPQGTSKQITTLVSVTY